MSSSAAHLTECPNCGAALSAAYCASCGQKNAPVNPSMRDVLHEVTHEFLHQVGRALRRTYGLSRAGGLWRTAGVGLVYGLAVVAALVGVVLPVVLMRR